MDPATAVPALCGDRREHPPACRRRASAKPRAGARRRARPLKRVNPMTSSIKITGLSTVVVNAEMRNWIFVKVLTDQDGLYGWGEASLNWKTRAVTGTVADLEPLVIGRDPRDIEQIV